ncbi:MAG: DUF3570 domain-containing protein [Saccharospirillaceae bacterium]|nr:DUF3570 domain-containing protein [Saccharospirillaceae bacterium]MCD8530819.1 DUF3570 domain-containing protein [Saccharospirillaceae bacterium]
MKPSAKSALLALAATAPVHALAPPQDAELRYRISQYQEQDIAANRVATGATQRYQISVQQLQWQTPLAGQWLLNLQGSYESLSGASPLQTFENSSGQSEVIMSGASIDESRQDAQIQLSRYFSRGTLGGGWYYSSENDYQAQAWNLAGSLELWAGMTTLNAGLSQSDDRLSPVDTSLSVNRQLADDQSRQRQEGYLGISQILNKYEVLQLTLGYSQSSGYLSDPYRTIDLRPDNRDSQTLSLMYRFFMKPWDGAAHCNYRLYRDSWGVDSHTLELRWYQNPGRFIGRDWRANIGSRVYRQQAADFYSLASSASGAAQSNDARLSAYGAITLELGIDLLWSHALEFSLSGQRYRSRESWGPQGSEAAEAPALVNYQLISAGVLYRY